MTEAFDPVRVAAENLRLPLNPTRNVIEMLQNDYTVAFITRYRAERTNGMNENQIRSIENQFKRLRFQNESIEVVRRNFPALFQLCTR